ncbi:Uncharacterised protein [Vibrio cholerae]|nr:Uncharacterised protein [Vibrio cholerae]
MPFPPLPRAGLITKPGQSLTISWMCFTSA